MLIAKIMIARQARKKVSAFSLQPSAFACSGFTMVEIAICLAIIGIALVSIIGVLPSGMHTQRDNREETIINQDATVLLEAIRGGARGLDDLTNCVYAITNYWTMYNANGTSNSGGVKGYTFSASSPAVPFSPLTNGFRIIGLLSTPEYTDSSGAPIPTIEFGGISNRIVAYVRSISGPAEEKPPQHNQLLRADSFSYRVLCVNAPVAADTNALNTPYNRRLAANLRELRLTFYWPLSPNGSLPRDPKHQTFRTLVAGQLALSPGSTNLYFYQPQAFVNVTNTP